MQQATKAYPKHIDVVLTARETTAAPSDASAATDPNAAALAEARREAVRARDEAARLASERADFERRLSERDAELTRMRTQTLPPDQQYQARLAEVEASARRIQEQAQTQVSELHQRIRAGELALYRSTAIREAATTGQHLIESLVGGGSEEEIDASIEVARAEYARIYSTVEQQVAARYQQQAAMTQQPPPVVVQQPIPVYPAPPQNPAYVQQPPMGGGYPTAPGALPPTPMVEGGPAMVSEFTTEEAVRSGKYGGAVREQLMRQLKMTAGASPGTIGALGVQPRQLVSGTQYVSMPGGVMQPQGLPTPPVVPPQYQQQYPQGVPQQPQYVTPAPAPTMQVSADAAARAAAMAAVQRTHAGQNPVLGQNAGAPEALHAAQQYGQTNGTNAQQAFSQRFQNTPPVSTN